jgi:thiol-disulfide isomerase/thioredoxin
MTKKIILRIFLGNISIIIPLIAVGFLTNEVVQVHEYALLKWIALLICAVGFYLSGLINKSTPLKFIPLLYFALLIFIPLRYFYFPLIIYLLFFATLSLLITRREYAKKYKILALTIMTTLFIYFLFSQPLILREGNVVEHDFYGDIKNGTTIWNFNDEKIKTLPKDNFKDVNNNTVHLESFQNKILYISFWATWCKPCIEQKPILEKLKAEFKNNSNIVFIDISIDQDRERWQKYINKNNPSGIQVLSETEAKTRNVFEISGIPYHLLVNSKGKYRQLNDFRLASIILLNNKNVDDYIDKTFVIKQ